MLTSHTRMAPAPQAQDMGLLSDDVHKELWNCVDVRLQRGDTLVKPLDFQKALEADYMALNGRGVSRPVRRRLANSMISLNRDDPERHVAQGVQNSTRLAFQTACSKLGWDPLRISMSGATALTRFRSHNQVRGLLKEVGVKPSSIDPDDCIEHAIRVASGQDEPLVRHDPRASVVETDPELTDLKPETQDSGVDDDLFSDDAPAAVADADEAEDTNILPHAERRLGALIGRVETRVAGSLRRVPRKLMLSPDGSGRRLLAQRNRETRELQPALRRGAQCQVQCGIDGVWREV